MILGAYLGDISHIFLLILTSGLPKRLFEALSMDKGCCWVDRHGGIPRVVIIIIFGVARQFPSNLKLLQLLIARTTVGFHMIRVLLLRNDRVDGLYKILRISVSFDFVFSETLMVIAGEIRHIGYLLFLDVEVLDYIHVSILYHLCIF